MASDWIDDHRRAWAVGGIKEEARRLREQARRARARFCRPEAIDGLYVQPGTWVAGCYEAAADALQECIDDLPQPEPLAGSNG